MSVTLLLGLMGAGMGFISEKKKAKAAAKANDREAELVRAEAPLMLEEAGLVRDEAGFLREEAQWMREDADLVRESARPLYASAFADEYNANLADEDATATERQYAELERMQRIAGTKALGAIHAQASAGGFTANGSALDVLTESAINAELDALNIRYEGLLKARASREEGNLLRYRAGNTRADAATVERTAELAARRAGTVDRRAESVDRRAALAAMQAGRVEQSADNIKARSKDIKKLGTYDAVSKTLTGLSGMDSTRLRQLTTGLGRRVKPARTAGWQNDTLGRDL